VSDSLGDSGRPWRRGALRQDAGLALRVAGWGAECYTAPETNWIDLNIYGRFWVSTEV